MWTGSIKQTCMSIFVIYYYNVLFRRKLDIYCIKKGLWKAFCRVVRVYCFVFAIIFGKTKLHGFLNIFQVSCYLAQTRGHGLIISFWWHKVLWAGHVWNHARVTSVLTYITVVYVVALLRTCRSCINKILWE